MGLILLVVSAITFVLEHSVPGGPFDRQQVLPPEIVANLKVRYKLDEPLSQQYAHFLSNALLPHVSEAPPGTSVQDSSIFNLRISEGRWLKWMDFGPSYISRSRTVSDIIRDQLPISAQLGVMALLVAIVVGLPLGILAALNHNTIWDYLGMGVAVLGISVPVIVLGPTLAWIFGVSLKWLPPNGWGAQPPFLFGFLPRELNASFVKHAIMPSLALGLGSSAIIARLTRASLLQVAREDYIRTARAKGLGERLVITRHALRNSLIPVVTILGPTFTALVTGTFVTELIFGIPGLGRDFVTSITSRDYPAIMGTILLYATFLVLANLSVDIAIAWLDPKVRFN